MTQHNDNDWCKEDEYCPNGCDPDTPSCPDCYPHDIDFMRDIARENELMEQEDK